MNPTVGKTYTWQQVQTHWYGEQTFLAKRDGKIVCATLVAEANPHAPKIMVVGTKPRNMQRAEEFCEQEGVIPIFMKYATNEWVFKGFYEFDSYTTTPARLEKHRVFPGQRLTRVIFMKPAAQRATQDIPDLDDDMPYVGREGRERWQTHLRRERDPELVREKKRRHKKETGSLRCEVCGFDFAASYGLEEFCEVHHRVPLAKGRGQRETRIHDLAVLCSNCHRAIHRLGPDMPTVTELKRIVDHRRG